MIVAYFSSSGSPNRPPSLPNLKVSAAKGLVGFSLTNREVEPISKCEVTLLDRGDDEWRADHGDVRAPMATASITWSRFMAKGQEMPAYLGRERDNFIVSCWLESTKQRRTAGVPF